MHNRETTITHYDPNIRWGSHSIQDDLCHFGYRGTYTLEPVSGNCRAGHHLSDAPERFHDAIEEALEQGGTLELTNAEGDVLVFGSNNLDEDRDFEEMVVGSRIINFTEEATP